MSTQVPEFKPLPVSPDTRIGIIAARFNGQLVDELLRGCLRRLHDLGVDETRVKILRVPGAYELPVAAQALARTRQYKAVICLGAVVRGDTPHFEYVAGEAARGIARVSLDEALPVVFGVLTTNTMEQAQARAGGAHGHAGERAADAAVEMIAVLAQAKN